VVFEIQTREIIKGQHSIGAGSEVLQRESTVGARKGEAGGHWLVGRKHDHSCGNGLIPRNDGAAESSSAFLNDDFNGRDSAGGI